jgi:hypothetical protein
MMSDPETETNLTFSIRARFGSTEFLKADLVWVRFDQSFKISVRVRFGSFSVSEMNHFNEYNNNMSLFFFIYSCVNIYIKNRYMTNDSNY